MKYFLLFLLLGACSSLKHHQHSKNHGHHANKHMLKKSHKDLIKAFSDPERDSWQRPQEVLKLIGNLKGKKIIDIGSGSGYFTKYFLKAGAYVVAADVDEKFLSHIQRKLAHHQRLSTSLIPYNDPQMGKQQFDFAFTANTYHHIDDRVTYFNKVMKGLKVGGKVVIVDFKNHKSNHGPPLWMRVSSKQVSNELKRAGFKKIIVNENLLERQYVVIGLKTL